MASAAIKLLGMAVLAMLLPVSLLPVSSAIRTEPLEPVTAIKNDDLASGSIAGCTPKTLARDMVLFCREPLNAAFPVEACCGVAVGTVARPSCFCQVKKEPSFGMCPLLNLTNMRSMLARCGASLHLTQTLYNPCDRSYKEDPPSASPSHKEDPPSASPSHREDPGIECPSVHTSSCMSYKVLSFVGLGIIALLMLAMGYLILRPAALQTRTVHEVTASPGNDMKDDAFFDASCGNENRDEAVTDASYGNEKIDEEICIMKRQDRFPENQDGELYHEMAEICDGQSDHPLLDWKTRFVGSPQVNKKPCDGGGRKKLKGLASNRVSDSNKQSKNQLVNGCRCKKTNCTRRCSCFQKKSRCTSKCKCQDCGNPEGRRESGTNTEPADGSEDSSSSIPGKAVQTSPSRDNRGSGLNKRPRN